MRHEWSGVLGIGCAGVSNNGSKFHAVVEFNAVGPFGRRFREVLVEALADAVDVQGVDFSAGRGDLFAEQLGGGFADPMPDLIGVVKRHGQRFDGLPGTTTLAPLAVRIVDPTVRVSELRMNAVASLRGGAGGSVLPASRSGVEVVVVVDEGTEPSSGIRRDRFRWQRHERLRFGHSADGLRMAAHLGRSVVDPALVTGLAPVGVEVVDSLFEAVGGGVDVGVLSRTAEGDVGELSATAGGKDMCPVVRGALGSVDGEGVAVVEMFRVEAVAGDVDVSSIAGASVEVVVVDSRDREQLTGDDPGRRVGCDGDE